MSGALSRAVIAKEHDRACGAHVEKPAPLRWEGLLRVTSLVEQCTTPRLDSEKWTLGGRHIRWQVRLIGEPPWAIGTRTGARLGPYEWSQRRLRRVPVT